MARYHLPEPARRFLIRPRSGFGRMVDSLLKGSDFEGALKAAALPSPEDVRYKAKDSTRQVLVNLHWSVSLES